MQSYDNSVRTVLRDNDCELIGRGEGGCEIWCSPDKKKYFPVDDSIRSRRHANHIMKISGINHEL